MEYSDYKADRPALEANFKNRIKRLKSSLTKKSAVVEVGSAYGYFLNLISKKVASHIGFEVGTDGVEYSKKDLGVNATTQNFMEHKFKKESIDLVVLWDVVEHLTEPDVYIKKVNEILKTGGKVALTTGDIDKFIPRIRKAKWRMIHPPTHVYYFSSKTISLLLKNNGFIIDSILYKSTYRNLGSVANQIICNRKALHKSVAILEWGQNVAKLTKLDKLNIPLNTFDIMEVIATKSDK